MCTLSRSRLPARTARIVVPVRLPGTADTPHAESGMRYQFCNGLGAPRQAISSRPFDVSGRPVSKLLVGRIVGDLEQASSVLAHAGDVSAVVREQRKDDPAAIG
jgi:hypothetical protein